MLPVRRQQVAAGPTGGDDDRKEDAEAQRQAQEHGKDESSHIL